MTQAQQKGGRAWYDWLLIIIAAITVLSAIAQIIEPETALSLTGLTASPETVYLFRLVSLLTALFGGMLLHAALAGDNRSILLLWAGLQKVISAAAVTLAVINGQLPTNNPLLVAGYDLLAGVFVLWRWKVGRNPNSLARSVLPSHLRGD